MDQLEPYPINNPIQIRDVLAMLWRRKLTFIIVFTSIISLGIYYARHRRARYDGVAQMIVTARGTAASTSTDASASNSLVNIPIMETPQTQIGMIMSDGMAQRTLDQLKNDALAAGKPVSSIGIADPLQFRADFSTIVKVINPPESNLLQVVVTQPDPKKAATWANAICQAFVQWKKDLALQTVQDIATSLKTKLAVARDQVAVAERAETAYKQRRHLFDVTSQEKAALDQYVARESDVQIAQQELAAQQQRLSRLQARLNETNQAIASGEGVRDDLLVAKLQSDLSDLEAKREAAAQQYTNEYPGIIPLLDSQIKDIKSRMTKAIKGTLDNKRPSLASQGALNEEYQNTRVLVAFDQAKLTAATRMRDQIKQDMDSFPRTMLEYTRLARNAELAQQTYSQLQLAFSAALLNEDTATGNVQVTQAAVPPVYPSGLPLVSLIVVVVLFGLIMGTGAALLTERGDHRVRSVERVRLLVGGPVIGVLPPISRWQMRRLRRGDTPPEVVESYSLTRANLALALRNTGDPRLTQHQTILVTSALPGEGKSVTAAELAKSTARSGKSVILVDADMRRPSQGELFNVAATIGLADVLSGKVLLQQALDAPIAENLIVLFCGNVSRNPTEMMSLPAMRQTLEQLKRLAEVVIIDAPACAIVADALLIAPYVDCILQVISLGAAHEDLVRDTAAALQNAAPKAMTFFINRAPRERGRRYRSYYYTPRTAENGNGYHLMNGQEVPLAALPESELEETDTIAKS
jgi:polysaccharide biosynthesis transport protein